jgi:RHS repeat-associated protein
MSKRTRNPFAAYFHPDHLGSSTFLTDADGNPYQFLLYLPFGETLAEQKSGGFSTQYRFNGKEQDQMTGLYNYGARFYDPMVSGWLSVDPLAEKYPGWSAFNYVMNNPVNFIDPDGKEIIIVLARNSKGGIAEQVRYSGGNLYTMNGQIYKGKNWFAKIIKNGLNDVKKADTYLSKMVYELESSKNIHYIEYSEHGGGAFVIEGEEGNSGKGSHVIISSEEINSVPLESGEDVNIGSSLAHELQHSADYELGILDRTPDPESGIKKSEIKAVNTENRYRANRNMAIRKNYGKSHPIPKSKLKNPCEVKDFCQ